MKWIQFNWLKVVAIIMVLAAILPIQYFVYYQMMNWLVLGAAIVTALQASTVRCGFVFWTFMLLAVVFNPVAPLHLRADVWQIADIVAALIFIISFFVVKVPKVNKVKGK
jgi:hypothetical protein